MTLSGIGSLVSVELTSVVWTGLMLGWVETMFCDGVMMVVVGLGPLFCDIENIVEGMASLSLDELTTGVGMGVTVAGWTEQGSWAGWTDRRCWDGAAVTGRSDWGSWDGTAIAGQTDWG